VHQFKVLLACTQHGKATTVHLPIFDAAVQRTVLWGVGMDDRWIAWIAGNNEATSSLYVVCRV